MRLWSVASTSCQIFDRTRLELKSAAKQQVLGASGSLPNSCVLLLKVSMLLQCLLCLRLLHCPLHFSLVFFLHPHLRSGFFTALYALYLFRCILLFGMYTYTFLVFFLLPHLRSGFFTTLYALYLCRCILIFLISLRTPRLLVNGLRTPRLRTPRLGGGGVLQGFRNLLDNVLLLDACGTRPGAHGCEMLPLPCREHRETHFCLEDICRQD
mmetsp:Transcript_10617/g.19567  ORF Transcript_10617/g.19567 Transcript_10617/m.19567 type:complete len:211 (+) Transcript_10617:1468-2100(+)